MAGAPFQTYSQRMFIGGNDWRGDGDKPEARTPSEIAGVLVMFLVLFGILGAIAQALD